MQRFVAQVELILTAVGLGIIGAVSVWAHSHSAEPWRLIGLVAIAIGALHGVLFGLLRQRQRRVRNGLLQQMSAQISALQGLSNRVVLPSRGLRPATPQPELATSAAIGETMRQILDEIEAISKEPLSFPSHRLRRETRTEK